MEKLTFQLRSERINQHETAEGSGHMNFKSREQCVKVRGEREVRVLKKPKPCGLTTPISKEGVIQDRGVA